MLISTIVVVWDQWWLLSKYLWIYSAMVFPLVLPPRWKRCCCLDQRQWYWCSLVIWEGGEGSEAVYLIKADWDFQWMHSRGRVLPGGVGGLLLMQHPQDKSHIWAFLSAYIVPPRSHATTDSVGIKTTTSKLLNSVHVFACVASCVCLSARLSIYLQPLVWLWSDTWCGCIVPPISAPSLPALSFYRKLIGSCHWCVKLLCVGHCRQLDYLFFIFSLLEQLSSALLLF